MAWYNNIGDFAGDLGSILQGRNPSNNQTGTPVPTSTFATPPASSPLPMAGSGAMSTPPGINQQQVISQLSSDPQLADIWGTIQNIGGDIWGTLTSLLPHNSSGGIDWGKIGGDVVGFIKNNKDTILQGLSAYSNYERQQQSDKYAKQGLQEFEQQFADKAPLRAAGQAGMLNPSANTPDLSKLAAAGSNGLTVQAPTALPLAGVGSNAALQTIAGAGSGNPFAKALPMAPAPTAPPPTTSPIPPQSFAPLPMAPSKPPGYSPTGQLNAPTTAGAPPVPGTTAPLPLAPVPPVPPVPPLTPTLPKVGGPPPPKLTLPYQPTY